MKNYIVTGIVVVILLAISLAVVLFSEPPGLKTIQIEELFTLEDYTEAQVSGSSQITTNASFYYKYPDGWDSDMGYIGPEPIDYFVDYGHEPNNAPIRQFDLLDDDDPFLNPANYTNWSRVEYMNKIKNAKRNEPDVNVIVDGKTFTKYDLLNFREHDGKDYGNVVIFISTVFVDEERDGREVRFGYEWHEFPGGIEVDGNSKEKLYELVSSVRILEK